MSDMAAEVLHGFVEADLFSPLAPSLSTGAGITEGDEQDDNTGAKDLAAQAVWIGSHFAFMYFQRGFELFEKKLNGPAQRIQGQEGRYIKTFVLGDIGNPKAPVAKGQGSIGRFFSSFPSLFFRVGASLIGDFLGSTGQQEAHGCFVVRVAGIQRPIEEG